MRSYQTTATSVGAGRTLRRTRPISAQSCHSASTVAGNAANCSGRASARLIFARPAKGPRDDLASASFAATALPCRELGRRLPGRLGQEREVDVVVDAVGIIGPD